MPGIWDALLARMGGIGGLTGPQGLGGGINPLTMGLLGAGGSMLGASGPSPYKTGIGTALGAGIGGGLGGYGLGQAMQQQQQRQGLTDQLMAQILGRQMGVANSGGMPNTGAPPMGAPQMPSRPGMAPGMGPSVGGNMGVPPPQMPPRPMAPMGGGMPGGNMLGRLQAAMGGGPAPPGGAYQGPAINPQAMLGLGAPNMQPQMLPPGYGMPQPLIARQPYGANGLGGYY